MFSFSCKKREQIKEKIKLVETEVILIFEYKKYNDKYCDKAKFYKQVVNKTLTIVQVLYPEYSLFFLFDNVTSQSDYSKDALQVKDINKGPKKKPPILYNSWFDYENICI